MQAADIGVVGEADRKQSPLDLFLIFAGANIVATTIQTGASLVPAFSFRAAVALVGVGSLVGALLVAALSPLGPRLGVPSVVAARAALGFRGAAAVALVLYVSNFVNLYLSALAWKSIVPHSSDRLSIWSIGLIGAGLSLFQRGWLDRYADFMLVLGALLVPVGGVLLSHFFVLRSKVRVEDLYDREGPYAANRGIVLPSAVAWLLGVVAYWAATPIGGTLPSLVVTFAVHAALSRRAASAQR